MKRASVRDLRYNFKSLESALKSGQEIEITKRRKVIAVLMARSETPEKPVQMPDFLGDMKKIFGDRILPTTGAEIVAWDRDRW